MKRGLSSVLLVTGFLLCGVVFILFTVITPWLSAVLFAVGVVMVLVGIFAPRR